MATAHAAIRSFFLAGPAGRLEALLNVGSPAATHAGLVCHPHPMFGGTMHNKVVFHAMKALHSFGLPVLRFNFRGTGLSAGQHDGGAEVGDVEAALAWLKGEFGLPIIFAGFSFGAAIGLRVCCPDPDVRALISLGTPVEADGRLYFFLGQSHLGNLYTPHCLTPHIGNHEHIPAKFCSLVNYFGFLNSFVQPGME